MDSEKKRLMIKEIKSVIERKKKLEKVDFDFKRALISRKDRLDAIEVEDMKKKQIDDGSLILYSENADLYVVYDSDNISNFAQDFGTLLRRNGLIFEVVRDENPQRLVIVINQNMSDDQIIRLRHILISYIIEENICEVSPSDIKFFRDVNGSVTSVEIIVNTVIFNSVYEKIKFVDDFKRYIIRNDQTMQDMALVVDKIDSSLPKAIGIKGGLLKAPFLKTPVIMQKGDDKPDKIYESMATPIVINTYITNNNASNGGVININNGVNINKVNNTYKNTSKNTTKIVQKKTREKRTITTFCKYLYDTKPEWYLEGKFVPLSEITDEYQMYFDDYDTIPAVISRKLAGILFEQKDARTKDGHAKKKLYSFEELKERAGF